LNNIFSYDEEGNKPKKANGMKITSHQGDNNVSVSNNDSTFQSSGAAISLNE
jgi:hypothetical protein